MGKFLAAFTVFNIAANFALQIPWYAGLPGIATIALVAYFMRPGRN